MFVSHHGPAVRLRHLLRQLLLGAFVVATLLFSGRSEAPVYSSTPPVTSADEPDKPHLAIFTTPEDFHLPGTQPNALSAAGNDPLVGCSGCHVGHITDNYAGSMMANSARDPLFRAALQIAGKDANNSGEFCIRCHVPNAWLNGRSSPSNGADIKPEDMNGITCNGCHRMVAPEIVTGETVRNIDERNNIFFLEQSELLVGSTANVIDRKDFRRGPFNINTGAHATALDTFMRSSLMCATCHEIDNPLLEFDPVLQEFKLNELNESVPITATMFPIERTYSEWKFSDFNTPAGVTGLSAIYPGIKRLDNTEAGPITVCQDCHMPLIVSPLVGGGVDRQVGLHQWAGGSSLWQTGIEDFWDGVAGDMLFNANSETQTLAARTHGPEMLDRAANVSLELNDRLLSITVTNGTGHKLPTGYAEGRRMWLEVVIWENSQIITRLGDLDDDGNIIAPLKVYEIKQGLTETHADDIGRPELAGEGFHFVLNNEVFKDNRIPPRGWTNAEYETKYMQPVGVNYADGQFADTTTYVLPEGTDEVDVMLMYQTASGEYLDFLEIEGDQPVPDDVVGVSVNWGQVVGQLRDTFDLDRGEQMDFAASQVPGVAIDKKISPSSNLLPGQPVVINLPFTNTGILPIGDVGIADMLPALLTNVTIQLNLTGGTTLNQTGNVPNLSWSVNGQLDDEIENTILINAVVDPQVSADTVISNTALMSATAGANVINRSAQASATVVVPRLQFAPASYTVQEDGGTVEVTVTMDKVNPFADTTFRVSTLNGSATAGADFVTLNNTEVTIPANALSGKFMVQIVNDDTAENNQSFNVVLNNATAAALGATKSAIITIENEDDGPIVQEDDTFLPSVENKE